MKRSHVGIFTVFCAVLASVLNGCQSHQHVMAAAEPGQTVVCAKCYEEMVRVHGRGGPRGGLYTNKWVAQHVCEDCKTEMSIYTQDDVLMIKCAKCAPEGVPCDRCSPPAGYAK